MPTLRWSSVARQHNRRRVFSPGLLVPGEMAIYRLDKFFETHEECVLWMKRHLVENPDATIDLRS